MSVAASDEDGSDEKQSLVRRRTITGGLMVLTDLAFICKYTGLFEVRPAQEAVDSLAQFPLLMLTRTPTLRRLTLQPSLRREREPARRNSSNISRISPRKSAQSVSL